MTGRVRAPHTPAGLHRAWPRWLAIVLLVVAMVGVVAAFRLGFIPSHGGTAAAPPAPTPAYPTARGEVRPVGQAKVGTLRGGVVNRLAVTVGQAVEAVQEIARINASDGSTELLVAPWRGTITDLPVHVGDTVAVGTVVASVADLSHLQVETTDVDEFIVGRVKPGNVVLVTVDALNQRQLQGWVRSVALEPRSNADGDDHYPTVIDLEAPPPELRSGMTVRVGFVQ